MANGEYLLETRVVVSPAIVLRHRHHPQRTGFVECTRVYGPCGFSLIIAGMSNNPRYVVVEDVNANTTRTDLHGSFFFASFSASVREAEAGLCTLDIKTGV